MKIHCFLFLLISGLSIFSLSGCAGVQDAAIRKGARSVQNREYMSALRHLKRAENYGDFSPKAQAEIHYLEGRAYQGLQEIEEAKAAYKYVIDHYPGTVSAYKAKENLELLEGLPKPVAKPNVTTEEAPDDLDYWQGN